MTITLPENVKDNLLKEAKREGKTARIFHATLLTTNKDFDHLTTLLTQEWTNPAL